MSESTPTQAPAVTWRTRAVRRVAGSVGAAVVLAGLGPAIANAAGADVPNPVAIALRASGRGISSAFSGSSTESVTACDPSASPVATVSASPDDTVESPLPSATVVESVTPVASESASAEPVETTAAPSADPSASETDSGSGSDSDSDSDSDSGEECEESASPSPTVAPTTEAPESEAPKDGNHGQIVSTVAKCAPRGKDPLLEVEGAPKNHGGFVRPAAHGDSLTTPWGTFDLSTQAGADALCAALDEARAELPEEDKKAEKERGKKDRVKKEKGAKGGKGNRPTS